MMKYCHMLIGIPGGGKSTWVNDNIFDRNTAVFSTDQIIENTAKAAGMTYNEVFEDSIGEATKIFFSNIVEAAAAGKNMVIDRTNLSKKSRKKILDLIPDDYLKVAVVVNCSDDFVLANRLANRPGKSIPHHVIENMKKTFEEPSLDEGFKSIVHIETAPQEEGE
jgi:predicted kinase